MMEWRKFSDVKHTDLLGKKCAIFRVRRKKMTVGVLHWQEYCEEDKESGWEDGWSWLVEYGTVHDVNPDDRFIILPELIIDTVEKY